jgi:hypothetical protein
MSGSILKEHAMTNRKAKIAAAATVAGLAALGGVALESNHGLPAATQGASGAGPTAIVTSASGATLPAAQPIALHRGATTRPPIVTRASGAGGGAAFDD